MRYDCDDILRILSSENDPEADDVLFDRHLENCPGCAALCDPGPELESILCNSLSRAVPADFEVKLRDKLEVCDIEMTGIDRLEHFIPYIVTLMSSALLAVLITNWNDLKGIFLKFDPASVASWGNRLYDKIRLPSADSTAIGIFMSNAPNILSSLLSIVAVIWIFSIIEYNRTPNSKAGA